MLEELDSVETEAVAQGRAQEHEPSGVVERPTGGCTSADSAARGSEAWSQSCAF